MFLKDQRQERICIIDEMLQHVDHNTNTQAVCLIVQYWRMEQCARTSTVTYALHPNSVQRVSNGCCLASYGVVVCYFSHVAVSLTQACLSTEMLLFFKALGLLPSFLAQPRKQFSPSVYVCHP